MIAWRFAAAPTSLSPLLVKPTTEGVRWLPSAFGITRGSPPSKTATTELVVPRSIPTVLGIDVYLSCRHKMSCLSIGNLEACLSTCIVYRLSDSLSSLGATPGRTGPRPAIAGPMIFEDVQRQRKIAGVRPSGRGRVQDQWPEPPTKTQAHHRQA